MDEEKAFDKTQQPFIINVFSKLGIEENFLSLIKGICENLQPRSYSVVKDGMVFPRNQEKEEDGPLLLLVLNIALEVL